MAITYVMLMYARRHDLGGAQSRVFTSSIILKVLNTSNTQPVHLLLEVRTNLAQAALPSGTIGG